MYADDTAISICASTPEELYIKIGYVCEAMSAWCQRNRLILNEKKTKYINFNFRRPLTENLIPFSASIKYLGTYLDSNLSWTCHVDHVCKQLNKAYYAILQMKYIRTTWFVKYLLYAGLLLHLFQYNIVG